MSAKPCDCSYCLVSGAIRHVREATEGMSAAWEAWLEYATDLEDEKTFLQGEVEAALRQRFGRKRRLREALRVVGGKPTPTFREVLARWPDFLLDMHVPIHRRGEA